MRGCVVDKQSRFIQIIDFLLGSTKTRASRSLEPMVSRRYQGPLIGTSLKVNSIQRLGHIVLIKRREAAPTTQHIAATRGHQAAGLRRPRISTHASGGLQPKNVRRT